MDTQIEIKPKEIAPGIYTSGGVATAPALNPLSGQPNIISSAALSPQQPLNLEGTIPRAENSGASMVAGAETGVQNFQDDYQKFLELNKAPEGDTAALDSVLKNLGIAEQGLQGRGQDQLATEAQVGLPDLQRQRADVSGLIKTQIAEYNALKTEYEKLSADLEVGTRGTGNADVRASILLGQQGAIERQKIAKLNSKASEIGLLQAQDQALAGNIETAQNIANRAVDLKYQDREMEYKIKQAQYDRVKEFLSGEETKRGKALEYALKKEEAALADAKQTEKDIQGIGLTLAKYGVNKGIIENVLKSKTFDEAIALAGANLQDPMAKFELEGARLNNQLTRERIATEQKQRSLMGQLSPKEKEEQMQALKSADGAIDAIDGKLTVIDGIMQSPALKSVVGTSLFSRGAGTFKGALGRFATGAAIGGAAGLPFGGVGAIPGAILGGTLLASQGAKDTLTGDRQMLIGSVEQLIDKEFLDNLIAVKAKGATFGALTDREGEALRTAATKISKWRLTDSGKPDGKVVGYNISEKEFKKEIDTLRKLTVKARQKAGGEIYSADEQTLLDNVFGSDSAMKADPSVYFNQ